MGNGLKGLVQPSLCHDTVGISALERKNDPWGQADKAAKSRRTPQDSEQPPKGPRWGWGPGHCSGPLTGWDPTGDGVQPWSRHYSITLVTLLSRIVCGLLKAAGPPALCALRMHEVIPKAGKSGALCILS